MTVIWNIDYEFYRKCLKISHRFVYLVLSVRFMSKKTARKVVVRVVNTILLPFSLFIRFQQSSGVALLLATALALLLANLPWGSQFLAFWHTEVRLEIAGFQVQTHLQHIINDGLMTLFFAEAGLEIKREILEGELSTPQKAILPALAALGGMLVPALFFLLFNFNQSTRHGWGIPTATDIAFSITIISLLGSKIPNGLKIFLAALAIADDLGAIIVIALFYSADIHWLALGGGLGVFGLLLLFNLARVKNLLVYYVAGFGMWLFFMQSGIHPTIAGVLFAISIPHRHKQSFEPKVNEAIMELEKHLDLLRSAQCQHDKMFRDQVLEEMQQVSQRIESPLQNLLHYLHPLTGFVIMPLFALANAGIVIGNFMISDLVSPLSLGILAGLMLGKSTGITLATWLAVQSGLAKLPEHVNFSRIYGMSWLAGIGFTMSIFIADLALSPVQVPTAKIAIIGASLLSGLIGYLILQLSRLSKVAQQPDLKTSLP